jgi:hypothetical protein
MYGPSFETRVARAPQDEIEMRGALAEERCNTFCLMVRSASEACASRTMAANEAHTTNHAAPAVRQPCGKPSRR